MFFRTTLDIIPDFDTAASARLYLLTVQKSHGQITACLHNAAPQVRGIFLLFIHPGKLFCGVDILGQYYGCILAQLVPFLKRKFCGYPQNATVKTHKKYDWILCKNDKRDKDGFTLRRMFVKIWAETEEGLGK